MPHKRCVGTSSIENDTKLENKKKMTNLHNDLGDVDDLENNNVNEE